MKQVTIGNKAFSKLICGTNAIYARSHFSNARDSEYKTRFTDDYIEETVNYCIDNGINTIETSANERIWDIVGKIRKNRDLLAIGSTRIDETSQMRSHQVKLKYLIDNKSDVCVIHAQFVERPSSVNEINGLERLIDKIREANLIVGVAAHKIAIVELCEKKYDVDTYLFPLNSTGFVCPGYKGNESVSDRIATVKGIEKPFILMKTLAAGRIPPEEGLSFALENSKESDIITLGIGSIEEAREAIDIVNKYENV
ncbi:hypothetical protein HQ585_17940 [candidate division KSB1 bacterium]|nr:hypothetical protein [candidate division KSB1 bacterium]